MKDSTHTEAWVDSLTARLRLDEPEQPAPMRRSARQMAAASIAASIVKGPSLVAEFEGTRSSTRGLTQLRELPPTATLLLYTPVLLPSGHVSEPDSQPDDEDDCPVDAKPAPPGSSRPQPTTTTTTDPFEMLGRALSKHHRRVRHVPYVPRVGFTPTHAAFLAKAHAVIVVTCEPATCADMETTLAKQAEFVGAVAAALEGDAEGRKASVPVVNFSFGGDEWENQVATYNHVWVGERYNGDSVMNIVKLVFG
ncbi:hypothetical protein LTR53_007156 [Teratosphaeriaceae sp. CCFEE 6253]|nr:hypothetical protein LTR53_007156 [Teratosphaeriaceae sp. CCFEE 6253]